MYIWQQPQWCSTTLTDPSSGPHFSWQAETLQPQLESIAAHQVNLLGEASEQLPEEGLQAHLDALVQTALRTSEIEGESLNVGSLRSSVVRKLGLQQAGFVAGLKAAPATAQTESLIDLLVEATTDWQQPLSLPVLLRWQASLFAEPSLLHEVRIGELRGSEPMQVVSGRLDNPTVHFEAPPRDQLESDLARFVHWFNQGSSDLNPLLRAGIAHLWLVTLHPFDDGNGRVTRAVTDRALAQAEANSVRFYSLSAAIMARRSEYYTQLEAAQKGDLDITDWLSWFLSVLNDALVEGQARFARLLSKTQFWQKHSQTPLGERQIKVLNRLLDGLGVESQRGIGGEFGQGIKASQYKGMAGVSKATATRDLSELVAKGCLVALAGGGRSSRYGLNLVWPDVDEGFMGERDQPEDQVRESF